MMHSHIPPSSDALMRLTEAQRSALSTLSLCQSDPEAKRSVEHWIRAWDKALGRGDTIEAAERIRRARKVWDGHLYSDGAGI